ncbi:amidohydrolase [Myxococcota bacterium]|nr:amidohydrolase [Myxococcota bacterium]
MSDTRYWIIDADTHVTEPPDLWTSRLPSKWADRAPHIEWDDEKEQEVWVIDGQRATPIGVTATAGWKDPFPANPPTFDDCHRGSHDLEDRLKYMDSLGIWAQVLYPNVGGFGTQAFQRIDDPALKLECVRAYNDFLIDWISPEPRRFAPVMATPFWDVEATVKEIERCAGRGHKGLLFTGEPHAHGLPYLSDRSWDPIWAAAQAAKLPVSFHIGSGDTSDIGPERVEVEGYATNSARGGSALFLANGGHILDLLFSGILPRFPELQFVSVESGVGWVPFVLQAADYQFGQLGVRAERPEFELKPSEYFRRQVYACCWFEKVNPDVLEFVHTDRVLFETDFPHPTSIYAQDVHRSIEDGLADLSETDRRMVLWDNTAALYGIAPP